jgi:SAM-dependent methyltransferase
MRCQICEADQEHKQFQVREMMYGMRDLHAYFLCSGCGCLQIESIPQDMSRYYGDGYYSFVNEPASGLKAMLIGHRNRFTLFGQGKLGALLATAFPTKLFDFLMPLPGYLTPDSRVADVGCGGGSLLSNFRLAGLQHAVGVDAFVSADVYFGDELLVRRAGLESLTGPLELIMFHHSFEHMPDPAGTLSKARALLVQGGYCILRVPLVSSLAWQRYGVNWVQLDAPRHLFLHSENSIRALAGRCGFECTQVCYDSTSFQFWGSEQYCRDIPLRDPRSHAVDPGHSVFSAADMGRFAEQAHAANSAGTGDQAAFYLRRVH